MELLQPEYKTFISPLIDWKVLDIHSFMNNSHFEKFKNYKYAVKILQRLRNKNILKVYRCAFNRKNYYYLTKHSMNILGGQNNALLNDETIFHDAMVSSLCLSLKDLKQVVLSIDLEHKIKMVNSQSKFDEIIPDARLVGKFNNHNFCSAIEIELHQKEKSRIIAKANIYLKSSIYDYVFYFFPDDRTLKNYDKILKEGVGDFYNQKIFLFTAPDIMNGKNRLNGGNGLVKGEQKSIYELFSYKNEPVH